MNQGGRDISMDIEKIRNLENNISYCENELLNLYDTYFAEENNDMLMLQRIKSIEARIGNLNRQLHELKSTVPQPQEMQQPQSQYVQPQSQYVQPQQMQQPQSQQLNQEAYVIKQERQPMVKKDVEKTIGKSIMGIVASILVFISIISFSALLVPFLTDEIKMAAMYLVSAAFICVGLIMLRKGKLKALFMTFVGCGMGALYISIFMTHIYFDAIGKVPMYILFFIWSIGCVVLSKMKSKAFLVIGQAGISISLAFGAFYCLYNSDMTLYVGLTIYYIIANSIFWLTHFDRESNKNLINDIFFAINLITFMFSFMICFVEVNLGVELPSYQIAAVTVGIIVAIYTFVYMIFKYIFIKLDKPENLVSVGIENAILFAVSWINLMFTLLMTELENVSICILLFAYVLVILVFTEIRYSIVNNIEQKLVNAGRISINVICSLGLIIGTFAFVDDFADKCNLFIWIIMFLLSGFIRKDNVHKFIAIVMYTIFAFNFGMDGICMLIFGILIFALFTVVVMTGEGGTVANTLKTWSYLVFQFAFFVSMVLISNDMEYEVIKIEALEFVTLLCMTVFNVLATVTSYGRDKVTGERGKSIKIAGYIVNGFLMIFALSFMFDCETTWIHALLIALSIAIFMLNSVRFIKGKQNVAIDIYLGLKFTVLLLCILGSYDAKSYFISVFLFILAIACITVGFGFKRKPLRIYGLVLTLISVLKLIIFDINYDNSFGRALSLFVSGLLCFGISILYNQVDKKISKDTE